jgi:hypothetical protein
MWQEDNTWQPRHVGLPYSPSEHTTAGSHRRPASRELPHAVAPDLAASRKARLPPLPLFAVGEPR